MEGNIRREHLFARIEELERDYIQFWIDVCKIESPTEYKDGVDRVGKYFINAAEKRSWEIEVQKQPVSGDCVCITMNPDVKVQPIVFSGHMDTVHPVGSFAEPIVTCDEKKIYGPGVLDCKGGAVAAFYAMAALDDCGFRGRPVKLILQSDEENGSRTSDKSTVRFMSEKAEGCIAFLNCEGFGTKGKVSIIRKGIRKYEFEVKGMAVHSAACDEGISAIREAAHKILQLEELKDTNGITCNCGLIHGGTAENTVPDKCVFTADFRFNNQEEMQEIDNIVKEITANSLVEGTTCKATLKSWRYAMEKNQKNFELLEKVNQICIENGIEELEAFAAKGGSDASDMTAAGIPCLDSFGVWGGLGHNPGEYAYLDSLAEAARKMAVITCCI